MPLLEQLSAKYPTDAAARERWAFSMMAYAATVPELEQRTKLRARASQIAVEAQKLGDNSQILQTLLELPVDGSEPTYSGRKEVDDALRSGEAAFVRGDFDKAREGYVRALLLDPENYDAALFTGDVYFKQKVYGSTGEWFARAIQIDPNREAAYRYWGDALMRMGRPEDARSKYVEAIVAEPYNRRSWQGAENWASSYHLKLHFIQLQAKSEVTQQDEKHVTLTLDEGAMRKGDIDSLRG